MLARTPRTLVYLSADELGITPAERAGLIEVRDDLASGRVKHVPTYGRAEFIEAGRWFWVLDEAAPFFNMQKWAGVCDCGTAHCIGGFMAARGIYGPYGDGNFSDEMGHLFVPNIGGWDDLTPAQAVRAIDHFLSGAGADCWKLALADEPA